MNQQNPSIIPIHIARSISPYFLQLILLPTEKCNLRCTYCYEDFEIGRMSPSVVEGVKNLITSRGQDLHTLHLSWFGGEPLLAHSTIVDICNHANEVARRNPQLRVESSMTTNAVLLDQNMARQMVEVGVRSYQISLDGPRDMHDKSRITAKGDGTYDQIWRNLVQMAELDLDFNVNLRIHYRLETWQKLFPLLDDIRSTFQNDRRFQVVFNPIIRMGGKNDSQITRLNQQEKAEIESELYTRVGKRQQQGTAAEATDKEHAVCYAATANSLVIRANGIINKCTVALSDDRNAIGHIRPDGTLALNREKHLPWLKGLETQNGFELACPYASHIKTLQQETKAQPMQFMSVRRPESTLAGIPNASIDVPQKSPSA